MKARALFLVPAALVVGLLSACGGAAAGAGGGAGPGSAPVRMPASVCAEPAYIRDAMPEGYCDATPAVDDDVSPTTGQ